MAPAPPEGLTVSTLISAKGAQLKFWIIQTNEAAEKKALNVTGTPNTTDTVTAPTLDESIRDRQWADLAALGVEWKEAVDAGRAFKLLESDAAGALISAVYESDIPCDAGPVPTKANMIVYERNSETQAMQQPSPNVSITSQHQSQRTDSTNFLSAGNSTSSTDIPHIIPMAVNQSGESAAARNTQSTSAHSHSSQTTGDPANATRSHIAAGYFKSLRDVIQQIESGAVATIQARYGPSADGRRKTADPSWGKYKNLVSKRERLQRILAEDFGGDKDKFFDFFSVKSSGEKEIKEEAGR
ncbi:hypothetical protein B0H14DRAFT_3722312 [Mycena olivaceomarginata]|nr:hypothetical protein B0H14DRAFT_3722312 [Mycena olivaceomarginata]